ncbi:MAG: DUF2914 domain-containing protein [Nitrospiraceae bacterium]
MCCVGLARLAQRAADNFRLTAADERFTILSMVSKLKAWFERPIMAAACFFAGVGYDTLTLTRIDRLQDNLILLLYLSLLGALIVLLGREDIRRAAESAPPDAPRWVRLIGQVYHFAPMAVQFLLGGLFSAYAIFYFRSASLTASGLFLVLIVLLLVANEFLRRRLSNVTVVLALYATVCFSFFTFFLPVMLGAMNARVFLIGVGLSLGVIVYIARTIARNNPHWSAMRTARTATPACAVIALLVVGYFSNLIPPVPLAMKFGGVFHEARRAGDRFELTFEKQWYQFWKRSDNPYPANEPVYCFTAVFAPVRLETTIYQHWHYRAVGVSAYQPMDRIPIKISGGRESGYRAITFKQGLEVGDWRVDVETENGRILGRVSFHVEPMYGRPTDLVTLVY